MKIAIIITVKNEAQAIEKLLESVISQTKQPDEIIIADAGSTDNTKERIKQFQNKLPKLKLINVKGTNRSQGRNKAIALAKSEIIAVTDAGCTLKNDWLEKITRPILANRADSVAGFYLPESNSAFSRCTVPFVAVMPNQFNPKTYLPSSRSIAFTKTAWASAGKYPRNLNYCEDLIFAKNLKTKTTMIVEPKALVYWQQNKNLFQFFHQISRYARGDIQARYWPHIGKIATVYLRYLILIAFPLLIPLYLLFPIIKHAKYIPHPVCLVFLPLFQIATDLAVIHGSISGLIRKK